MIALALLMQNGTGAPEMRWNDQPGAAGHSNIGAADQFFHCVQLVNDVAIFVLPDTWGENDFRLSKGFSLPEAKIGHSTAMCSDGSPGQPVGAYRVRDYTLRLTRIDAPLLGNKQQELTSLMLETPLPSQQG